MRTDSEQESTSAIERRLRLRLTAENSGFVAVAQMADLLGVSVVTVRSDLAVLASEGVLQRVRGGAIPIPARSGERSLEEGLSAASDEKAAIGREAAASVSSGQSIVLDVGTTPLAIAHALVKRKELRDVTVITNGLSTALALEPAIPRFTVVVTGGTLRPLQHSLVEPLASEMLERIRADVAFIGCTGVHPEAGVTNVNLPEAALKRRMLRAATRRIVVADSSKLGVIDLGRVAATDEFDRLLTGAGAAHEIVADLEEAGLAVTRCRALGDRVSP
ncbi:DeoR/GlpR family DNA-binding transcription regulator [Rathayibacter rathayi]|uniref:DeoR/GlpR family DNA-binding transcription regulator n=1 Tax=Rathayibacter rathayi TaxID=33887 RepID=UPI000CE8C235|nr:DeoR/GlpR family DNA-binding transcription regulator [Rathayibacter rathayi]PPG69458.1 DeoR/GlpR transcriptional regulator [Rathayibacter rathayi]PPG77218.1 DeoR/GlpR transcriptional regulator [Rathayibacter rathayi]PPI74933.1 DeoR/GlpR transcriptional regulator [Rathayibacter rathayi]PPI77794.1 DeoR/GlpR transcriptional regulator [Rathayibacter rathayi]